MELNIQAPVALFAYNRPDYLAQTLLSLKRNHGADQTTLFIYCDGPKANATTRELERIKEVRTLAKADHWCGEVHVIEKTENDGLAKSIINGVSELVRKYGRVIVLEDDLISSPYLLDYFNTALQKYKDREEVISVSGYNFPATFNSDTHDTFFLKSADCWGWATWDRGWKLFEHDANHLAKIIKENGLIKDFDFNASYPFYKMLKKVAKGKLQSWAIRWYATAFINNKVSLYPKLSLINNIGNIGTNVKADNSDIYGAKVSLEPVTHYENSTMELKENRIAIEKHLRKYDRRRLTLFTIRYFYTRFIRPVFKMDN